MLGVDISMNFDKKIFSEILIKIKNTYGSINKMAEKTGITSAYLSKLIRLMYNNAPSPEILKKIADNSNGIISYAQLMEVCGYIDVNIDISAHIIKQHVEYILRTESYLLSIGLTEQQIIELQDIVSMDISSKEYRTCLDTFLEKLSLDQSYNVLKMLQSMFYETRKSDEEKLSLAKSLQNEADELIDKVHTIQELNNVKQKYKKEFQFYMCPVYGQISAGQPNWAEECIEGRIPIDPNLMNIVNPEEHFFLRVNGESMNKVIKNGAYALIHKQDVVEDGEIAVVLVNGYDATLKKFTRQGDLIILEPDSDDNSFKTQAYDKNTSIKILGKYIGKMEFN